MKFATNTPSGNRIRRRSLAGVAVVAVLVGGLATRFVTASSDPALPPPTASVAATGSPAERVAALEQRVAAAPDDLSAWQGLAGAYLDRAAAIGDSDDYGRAAAALDSADRLVADHPITLIGRGQLALSVHKFGDALEVGTRARAVLPDNPAVFAILVDAEIELGLYDDAAATLQEFLDRRPALAALSRASYLRQLNGDLPAAIAAMEQAAQAGSASAYEQAVVTALLGDLYRRAGDLDAAAAAYERASEAAPDLVAAQVGAAWVRAAEGDVDGAIATLEVVVEGVTAPAGVLLLNDLQRATGRDDDGDATAERVRDIAVQQVEAGEVVDLELALFEAEEGRDLDRAVELARSAYEARPDNVFVADALAWTLFRSGDTEAAVPLLAESLRLGSTEPLLRYHAAEITLAAGDTVAAAEHLRLALVDEWFSFRHHDRLLALADQLGVTAPSGGGS